MAKSSPLNIDELIQAQQRIVDSAPDKETQEKALAQIAKLTKLKGDSQTVTLGDVKTELKGLRQDLKKTFTGTDPKDGRTALPAANDSSMGNYQTEDSERKDRLVKLSSVIGQKTAIQKGGSRNEALTERNKSAFDKFITETEKRDSLLAEASKDQQELFKRLEDTLVKLREAGSDDSERLVAELGKIRGELDETAASPAKEKIKDIARNAEMRATTGERGNQGTLGDAWAALRGKKTVLKEGFGYDTTAKGGVRNTRTGEAGNFQEAKMGRLRGAASILGNVLLEKNERNIEGTRSEGIQKFLGNFGQSNNMAARLEGKQEALSSAVVAPKATAEPVSSNSAFSDSGTLETPEAKITPPVLKKMLDDMTEKLVTAISGIGGGLGGLGSMLPDIDLPGGKGGKPTAKPKGKPGIFSRAGQALKKAGPGIVKGGAAALGGMALGYGADKLKDSGHEKLGGAADVGAEALTWGGTGAMLGSVIPGVGTAIGGGIGAVGGAAYGLYKNWDNLFGGEKLPTQAGSKPAPAAPTPSVKIEKKMEYQSFPIIEDYKKMIAKGEITPDRALTAVKSLAGNSNPALVKAAEKEFGSMKAVPKQSGVAPAKKSSDTAAVVGTKSAINETMKTQQNTKPVVIQTGGQTALPPPPPPAIHVARAPVRSSESALEQYAARTSHFW